MKTETFDFVVIGAGSAGCVVAARLVEAGANVLLLEAGGPDASLFIRMPAGYPKLLGPNFRWDYETEPQPDAAGRRIGVPQGRVVGGSSSINGMVYVRGQPRDYDGWRDLGAEGWGWDDVLPWFKTAERNGSFGEPLHGSNGPMHVNDVPHRHPLCVAFVQAAQERGLPFNPDFNGASQIGAGYYQATLHRGRRVSSASAYLGRLRGNARLTLRTNAMAREIKLAGDAARGVVYAAGAETIEARAERGVIVSAGAIATPKLLMLSGIGPENGLRAAGVTVTNPLPGVGRNYQDHASVSVLTQVRDPISLLGQDKGLRALRHGAEWMLLRRGLLASNIIESGGFADLDGDGRADIQMHVIPIVRTDRVSSNVAPDVHGVTISALNLRPRSRGEIRLRGANPDDAAIFNGNYLKEPADVEHLSRGVQFVRQIVRAPAFADLGAREMLPGPALPDDPSALMDYVRRSARTVYHPTGTCRMGVDEDSVVDPRLRVHGLDRLWVADASVMPTITSGNTHAPTVMIAERAAKFILDS